MRIRLFSALKINLYNFTQLQRCFRSFKHTATKMSPVSFSHFSAVAICVKRRYFIFHFNVIYTNLLRGMVIVNVVPVGPFAGSIFDFTLMSPLCILTMP